MFIFDIIMYPRALVHGSFPLTAETQILQNQLSLASSLKIAIYICTFCGQDNKGGVA